MKLAIGINQYDIPIDLAETIINACKHSPDLGWSESMIGSQESEQYIRTSTGFSFSNSLPELSNDLEKHIRLALDEYSKEYSISVTQSESLNLLKYEPGQKYDFHFDTDWTYYRTVSVLVYLNPSEYEGGETHFKHFDLKVKPEKPSIVIFPSNYSYLHSALPVVSGEKFIVVSWMNDLPAGIKPDSFYLINSGLPL